MRAATERNRIYNAFELIDDPTPDPEDIIEGGILGVQNLLMIVGKAKVRKTMMGLGMAVSLAAGRSYATFKIHRQVRVLYLSAEGGKKGLKDRLRRITSHLDPERRGKDNLYISVDARYRIDTEKGLEELRKLIEESRPEVVFLDPFVRFHNSDENSSQDMGIVMTAIRDIIDDLNVSVVLIHHAGKNDTNDARGSSVINGEYDACIRMAKPKGVDTLKAELSFELRNDELPKVTLTFNKDTFVFEAEGQRSLHAILESRGPLSRKELAKEYSSRTRYSQATAYRRIATAARTGEITKGPDRKYKRAA